MDCASQSSPCHIHAKPCTSWTQTRRQEKVCIGYHYILSQKRFFLNSTTDDQATLKITHHHSLAETSYEKLWKGFFSWVCCCACKHRRTLPVIIIDLSDDGGTVLHINLPILGAKTKRALIYLLLHLPMVSQTSAE